MRYRLRDGVGIAYSIEGDGPPLVFLHCWGCSRSFWHEQASYFADSHRVLTLDFRGHGDSSVPNGGYTLRQLASDVHEVLVGLETVPTVVVGHSMGGIVAQRLAIDHPEAVQALVLVATTSADPDDSLVSAKVADESDEVGYVAALRKNFRRWFLHTSDESVLQWTQTEMLRTPSRVTLGLVDDYRGLDIRPRLPDIKMPTLVIGARGDVSTPVTSSELMAELIPDSELIIIDGAGHFVQLERPQEVNLAIQRFLSARGL